jgi:preprotein translocase subunit SecD
MTLSSRPTVLLGAVIWLVVTVGGAYLLYNIRHYINFGIDLVGGTYLTLDVKVEEAVKNELLSSMQDVIDTLKKGNKELPATQEVREQQAAGTLVFSSPTVAAEALRIYKAPRSSIVKIIQDDKIISFTIPKQQLDELQQEAVEGNINILRTRLDAFGAGEIGIVPQGARRIGIELPNVTDPAKAKARIGTAAVLEMKPVYDYAHTKEDLLERYNDKIPEGSMIVPGKDKDGFYLVPVYAKVTGKQLKDVRYEFLNDFLGKESPHSVALEFKPDGATKFYEITKEYVGKPLAIVIDNVVVSAPRVNAPIDGGRASISGSFTEEQAKELVTMLKSGSFIAPVEVIEERHIGPSLGQESIYKGLLSCGIALGLLLLFSVTVYKVAGIFAFVVLLYNLLLILFGLALIPDATLTLPGIAGMILTVGMAIDSSILIYERVKEELSLGASLPKAVDTGFNGALAVILDANITTFIIGAVLYYLGSPAIQGFALTMMIGIISTLITGLVLLRWIFNAVLSLGVHRVAI